jgi:GNAT superfamily N-acetyltransferase
MELTPVLYDAQDPRHEQYITAIASIHAACITADRTIMNFHFPLSHAKIVSWWRERAAEPDRAIIVCLADGAGAGEVVGVVTLRMPSSETEPFKGLVEKLLVSPARRRAGVAHVLMRKLEDVARENGKSMLVGAELCRAVPSCSAASFLFPGSGEIADEARCFCLSLSHLLFRFLFPRVLMRIAPRYGNG